MHAYANGSQPGDNRHAGYGRQHGHSRSPIQWRALELAAMVLGFIVFWPVGLAVIAFKIWQRRSGYQGSLFDFGRERVNAAFNGKFEDTVRAKWREHWGEQGMWNCGHRRRERADRSWGFAPRTTGNAAFDDWRAAELTRIEEERRKLWAAEQEFSEYMDSLRRARDREEFDRFMNQRRSSPPPADQPPHQPQA